MPTPNDEPIKIPGLIKIAPPFWILLFLAIAFVANRFLGLCWYLWRSRPLAFVLAALGVALVIWARQLFVKHHTQIMPSSPQNQALVTSGPFAFSRNPMYWGIILFTLGIGFYSGTVLMFGVPVLMFILLNFVFIPFEEQKMLRQFPQEFAEYKRRVRRWI